MKANKNIQNEKLTKKIILSRVVAHFSRENEQTRENLIYKEKKTVQHESERGAVEVGSIYILNKVKNKLIKEANKQHIFLTQTRPKPGCSKVN